MKNGGAKHESEILDRISKVMEEQNGVISHGQIVNILCRYYSQQYAESTLFQKVEREIIRRNIAKPVKVNFNNSNNQIPNNSQLASLFSLYISPNVPQDQKQPLIFQFIRSQLPNCTIPPLKRSISKELIVSQALKLRKRAETMEFPTIQYRAFLLHQFLITTFQSHQFSLEDISNSIPIHLSCQIIRSYEKRPLILSLIDPLASNFQFEIDMILQYLKPPFHALLSKINETQYSIIPSTSISIPQLKIEKEFHFLNDISAYSDFWLYLFSLGHDAIHPFPIMIADRFGPFITHNLKHTSINLIPFFPYQIESYSQKVGLTPALSSYSIQKILKKRLNTLRCSRDVFLETKFYPISGVKCFLISHTSFHPISLHFFSPFSTPFEVNSSIPSLAKLFVAARMTDQGYIVNRRSNFKLFKKQVNKWLNKCDKITNFVSSINESVEFTSLSNYQMALLIEEMKFPSFYFERLHINLNEIENENLIIDHQETEKLVNTNPSNYVEESLKHLNGISFVQHETHHENTQMSNLNEIFTTKFPDCKEINSNDQLTYKQQSNSIANLNNNNSLNDNLNHSTLIDQLSNNKNNSYSSEHVTTIQDHNSNTSFVQFNNNTIHPNVIEQTDDNNQNINFSSSNSFDQLNEKQNRSSFDQLSDNTEYQIDDELSDFDDKKIEYPRLNYDDFTETTQSQFIKSFELKRRIVDVQLSVSVAIEFLKVVLYTKSDESTNELKFRQVVHFSQQDAIDAIFFLNSIDIYQNSGIIKYPVAYWNLKLPQSFYPDPIFIHICENDEFPQFQILWNLHKHQLSFESNESFDGYQENSFVKHSKKKISPASIHKNEHKGQLEFEARPLRFEFPSLPSLDHHLSYNTFSAVYDVDPLSQFCFGQYEPSIPYLKDFTNRFLLNVICSGGVYGISLSDIIHSCGETPLTSDTVISSIHFLSSLDLICRVPSSHIVPYYSCFLPCNTICRPLKKKIELVPCHIWINFEGSINEKVKIDLMNNVTAFVFANEFCDFVDLMAQFAYVSPYDLCLILQLLEFDEILLSQYYQIESSDLFNDEVDVPIQPFSSFEKFLVILDAQRKDQNCNPKFYRRIRTNRSMLPNLCTVNNSC